MKYKRTAMGLSLGQGRAGEAIAETSEQSVFTFSELFAGIGGFRVALAALGGRCVFSCDSDAWAAATYAANFGEAQHATDIRFVDDASIPTHDVLTAGFPCQPFSTVGRRGGFDDQGKGHLFYEIVRVAGACRPRALLLENVRGLLTMPGAMSTIETELRAIGYTVSYRVLNTRSYAPQHRERLYIVAFREEGIDVVSTVTAAATGLPRPFAWPGPVDLGLTVGDILSEPAEIPASLVLEPRKWDKIKASAYYQRHPDARLCPRDGVAQTLMANYKSGYLLYTQFVGVGDAEGGQEAGAAPGSKHRADALRGGGVRFWTPRECLRLQGFPEEYQPGANVGRFYRQIGNAVSPPVVAAVCQAMLEHMGLAPAVPVTDGASPAFRLACRAVPTRTLPSMMARLRGGSAQSTAEAKEGR